MLTQEEFEKVVVRLKGDEVDVEAQATNEDEITQETAKVPGPAAIPAPVQLCQLLSELRSASDRGFPTPLLAFPLLVMTPGPEADLDFQDIYKSRNGYTEYTVFLHTAAYM